MKRYRHSSAITVAAVIALIAAIPLAVMRWYFLPILLLPLGVALWSWRAGTDLDADGLTLRAPIGRRRVPWDDVEEIAPDRRGRVYARLAGDRTVRLPAVRIGDLGDILTALSGRAR